MAVLSIPLLKAVIREVGSILSKLEKCRRAYIMQLLNLTHIYCGFERVISKGDSMGVCLGSKIEIRNPLPLIVSMP
jgi:hypothetical protein